MPLIEKICKFIPIWFSLPVLAISAFAYWYCNWLHENECRLWFLAREKELGGIMASSEAANTLLNGLWVLAFLAVLLLSASYIYLAAGRFGLIGDKREKTTGETHRLNYELLDRSEIFTLWNAAHYWTEQEPIVDHPGGRDPFYQTFQDLKTAVDMAQIVSVDQTQGTANRNTRASREELRSFALTRRERPKFLFPEERLTRQQAVDLISDRMVEFIDHVYSRDPIEMVDIEDWWGEFFDWRLHQIVPLVERIQSRAAANNFTTFVSFETIFWNESRGLRYNHIKTMMDITLQRIQKIIEEFKQ